MIAEHAGAQVLVQGRVFAIEVGDGQVGQPVTVDVAAGDTDAARFANNGPASASASTLTMTM